MKAFSKRHSFWLVPLCLGATIPPFVWYFEYRDYTVPGTKYKHSLFRTNARLLHVPEEDLIALQRVEDKMGDHQVPTASDWKQVKAFLGGTNDSMKADALRTVSRMSRFGNKQEGIDLVEAALNSPANQEKDQVVASSLVSLYEMQAPDWQSQVNRYRNSQGKVTAEVVENLLRKEVTKR